MTFKVLVNQQSEYICDICGEVIGSVLDIGIRLQQTFWHMKEMKSFDICKKHRKAFLEFIEKEKKK